MNEITAGIEKNEERYPMIALRGMVMFPRTMLHFEVSRRKSMMALKAAMSQDQKIFVVSQKNFLDEDVNIDGVYSVGVVATVRQILNVSSENARVIIEGEKRAVLKMMEHERRYISAVVEDMEETDSGDENYKIALVRNTRETFDEYASLNNKLPPDIILSVLMQEDCGKLADYLASNLLMQVEDKQFILEERDKTKRLEKLCVILEREKDIMETEHSIAERVKERIDRNQREYYLREQMRAIADELGESESPADEGSEYYEKIEALSLPEDVEEKLLREVGKYMKMPSSSHEAYVIHNYLDACLELPWNTETKDNLDLVHARRILDRDHYGLDRVKDRIIEFLAVRKLAPDIKGQIICLVGPPGVGKTSVAKSIATAMGRKYQRISLGGVNDEAEIRGHRRTYVGAMQGRIMSAVNSAKTKNPLILLDEIDKLTSNLRGDPTSALLEVLDPEQNSTFTDHYIDLPFDLSKVIFITTANTTDTIPGPLLDRMEIISLPSYTREEKFNIAKKHLAMKQIKRHGMNGRQLRFTDKAIYELIDGYTREAGVRNLERQIASVCRKAAKLIANGEVKSITVNEKKLREFLGPRKFRTDKKEHTGRVGVVTGLAWTAVGGETMPVEAVVLNGNGKLKLTGSLGDVMKESAQTAVSYIRSKAETLKLNPDFYSKSDIHIHVPEGAIPKDGPSAGVTIATALVSALTGKPVSDSIAMTGEISLTGRVMAIGGLKEKTMAAYSLGIEKVIIPRENEPDLEEIDPVVRKNIEFVPVRTMDEVIGEAIGI